MFISVELSSGSYLELNLGGGVIEPEQLAARMLAILESSDIETITVIDCGDYEVRLEMEPEPHLVRL